MQNPTQELTLAINVFLTGVSMPESCDVQVRRNPLSRQLCRKCGMRRRQAGGCTLV